MALYACKVGSSGGVPQSFIFPLNFSVTGNCPYTETAYSIGINSLKIPTKGINTLSVKSTFTTAGNYVDDNGGTHTLSATGSGVNTKIDTNIDVSNYDYILLTLGNGVINAYTSKTMNITIDIVN